MNLALTDIEQARNKKHGYNNSVRVLEAAGDIVLIERPKMSYFSPSGKARLRIVTTYSVEGPYFYRSFSSKTEARKAFRALKKPHINPC